MSNSSLPTSPYKAFTITENAITFTRSNFLMYFEDLGMVPLHEFIEKNNSWLLLDKLEINALFIAVPKYAQEYCDRVYFQQMFYLVDFALPNKTQWDMQYEQLLEDNMLPHNFSFPDMDDIIINEEDLTNNDDNYNDEEMGVDPYSKDDDNNVIVESVSTTNSNEDDNKDDPMTLDEDQHFSEDDGYLPPGYYDQDYNYNIHPQDDISRDEHSPQVSQDPSVFKTDSMSSSGFKRSWSQEVLIDGKTQSDHYNDSHSVKFDNNKNLRRAQYIYPDRFARSGPKQRGPQRCNGNNKHRKPKHQGDKTAIKQLVDLRNQKRAEKIKAGREWKMKNNARASKNQALLNQAYSEFNDRNYGERQGKLEAIQTELDYLMRPDVNNSNYENAFKERNYLHDQQEKQSKEHKRKQYATEEVIVNKRLHQIMDNFNMNDLYCISKTSSVVDDLQKVEDFITVHKESKDIDMIVSTVATAINKTPNLLDKCSNFLKDLILKLKPTAFTIDAVRDVVKDIDILKDDSIVTIGESCSMAEISENFDIITPDMRDDHARRGDLVHVDPILRRFVIRRTEHKVPFGDITDYAGVMSTELLFQLLSPSVCQLNLSKEQVIAKMIHVCANIHTINLPKWSIIEFNTDIVQDTLLVARAIYNTRLRVMQALGFPLTSQ